MDKEQKMENVADLFSKFHQLHAEYAQLWLKETFLHWDWWLSALLSVVAWGF